MVAVGDILTIYRYENHSNGISGLLDVCNGMVSYASFGLPTDWHGEFVEIGAVISMCFDYRGKRPYKASRLRKVAVVKWKGFDYRGRSITLTRLGTMTWNPATETWN